MTLKHHSTPTLLPTAPDVETTRECTRALIELVDVGVTINGQEIVRNVSLSVDPGETVAIIGRSGVGKTTVLRVMAGLMTPSGGRARVGNPNTSEDALHRVGFVPQHASLLPWRTLADNVSLVFDVKRTRSKDNADAVRRALEAVGLLGMEHRYPSELSGGQQQRGNLARALVADPDVLLLDEPFSSVDERTREHLTHAVHEARQRGTAIVFVTHNVAESIELAQRVAVMAGDPGSITDVISGNGDTEGQTAHLRQLLRLRESGNS